MVVYSDAIPRARLTSREIHADVNAGTSLVECLREIDERRAKHREWMAKH